VSVGIEQLADGEAVRGFDVILALAGLWEIDPATDWKARARTLYDLVFTGLKADPPADQITSP
jgi:hypothetical protein